MKHYARYTKFTLSHTRFLSLSLSLFVSLCCLFSYFLSFALYWKGFARLYRIGHKKNSFTINHEEKLFIIFFSVWKNLVYFFLFLCSVHIIQLIIDFPSLCNPMQFGSVQLTNQNYLHVFMCIHILVFSFEHRIAGRWNAIQLLNSSMNPMCNVWNRSYCEESTHELNKCFFFSIRCASQ